MPGYSISPKVVQSKTSFIFTVLGCISFGSFLCDITSQALDDYVNAHPTSGYELQLAEQKGTYPILSDIADILGTDKAIAQGSTPQDLLPQSVIEYFDGGIYSVKDPNFPRERWNFGGALCHDDNDFAPVFDKSTELYQMIGRHIEEQYRAGQVDSVVFASRNTREIGVLLDLEGTRYVAFKKLEPGMMDAILRYEKP